MKFVSRQPREGINVSDTHPLVEAGTLVAGLTAIFLLIAVALIFLADLVLYFVPPEKEAALFRDWLPDDISTVSPSDARLNKAQRILDRMASHWGDTPYAFRLEIDDSELANAMAFPGGLIVVTEGLLDQVKSENEIAFVLGHELGHYRNRDHLRALGRGIVLSVFLAAVTGSDASGLGINVTDLALRSFSRKQELAADEFGLELVYTQYGHVNEAWRLFERWDDGGPSLLDIVTYTSTHPQPGNRVDSLEQLARERRWPTDGAVSELRW